MKPSPHLEETLQRDIDGIRAKVSEMARLAERALTSSVQALTDRDRRTAYAVILRDQYIDEIETELDRLCLEFLVRHQPAGVHLRFVYTAIQVNKEIERIGDYAESIARQALTLSSLEPPASYALFKELAAIPVQMLGDALRAFLDRDADLAWRTMAAEERANELRNAINAELADLARSGKIPTAAVTPLMTVARRLERAADQAKNFCEDVLYLCTGEFIKHKGAEGFRVLFVDVTNASLSQVAEGLGNSLKLPRFTFSSAGIAPKPLDSRAVDFMARRGIDISSQTSKALSQVPDSDHYQVIVALSPAVLKSLGPRPGKPILLNWPLQDPANLQGPPEAVSSAYQSACQALEEHLRDLAGAISDNHNGNTKL